MLYDIEYKDFINYEIKHEIAGAFGINDNKSLCVITNVSAHTVKFLVDDRKHKKADYFVCLEDAINFYNSL